MKRCPQRLFLVCLFLVLKSTSIKERVFVYQNPRLLLFVLVTEKQKQKQNNSKMRRQDICGEYVSKCFSSHL